MAKIATFFVVYLPYIIRVETVELGTSRDAFPMSANISESKAAIQSRPPDQYNSYFVNNGIKVQ